MSELADFPCSVPVVPVDEVDQASFDPDAPLVMTGAMTRAVNKWTDAWLVRRFGARSHRVTLDSRPARYGGFEKQVSLGVYLQTIATSEGSSGSTEYLFQTWMERHFEAAGDLLNDLDVPHVILEFGIAGKWRFFVGPRLSGTLPHHHHAAINALARGRKRWAVYVGSDPRATERLLDEGYRGYNSGAQAREWFERECPRLRSRRSVQLWEFAQGPGDLVYIPENAIHAILNLEPVVGFGAELFPPREYYSTGPARRRAASPGGPRPWAPPGMRR